MKNLNPVTSEPKLVQLFSQYGQVHRVRRVKDFAFVFFESRSDALRAMEATNDLEVDGSKIHVALAKPQTNEQKQRNAERKREREMRQGGGRLGPPNEPPFFGGRPPPVNHGWGPPPVRGPPRNVMSPPRDPYFDEFPSMGYRDEEYYDEYFEPEYGFEERYPPEPMLPPPRPMPGPRSGPRGGRGGQGVRGRGFGPRPPPPPPPPPPRGRGPPVQQRRQSHGDSPMQHPSSAARGRGQPLMSPRGGGRARGRGGPAGRGRGVSPGGGNQAGQGFVGKGMKRPYLPGKPEAGAKRTRPPDLFARQQPLSQPQNTLSKVGGVGGLGGMGGPTAMGGGMGAMGRGRGRPMSGQTQSVLGQQSWSAGAMNQQPQQQPMGFGVTSGYASMQNATVSYGQSGLSTFGQLQRHPVAQQQPQQQRQPPPLQQRQPGWYSEYSGGGQWQ